MGGCFSPFQPPGGLESMNFSLPLFDFFVYLQIGCTFSAASLKGLKRKCNLSNLHGRLSMLHWSQYKCWPVLFRCRPSVFDFKQIKELARTSPAQRNSELHMWLLSRLENKRILVEQYESSSLFYFAPHAHKTHLLAFNLQSTGRPPPQEPDHRV